MFLIISFLLLKCSSSKKRTRCPTRNLDLLGMKPDEKKSTPFNSKGQVVYNENGEILFGYIGTLVRSQHNVPIQVQDWHHIRKEKTLDLNIGMSITIHLNCNVIV